MIIKCQPQDIFMSGVCWLRADALLMCVHTCVLRINSEALTYDQLDKFCSFPLFLYCSNKCIEFILGVALVTEYIMNACQRRPGNGVLNCPFHSKRHFSICILYENEVSYMNCYVFPSDASLFHTTSS